MYDKGLKLLYRWQTPEFYVTSATVSKDGSLLAAAVVYISDDSLVSAIRIFSLDAEGVVSQSKPYDGMCLSIWPTDEGFAMLTDVSVVMTDTTGEELAYCSFDGGPLADFCFDGEGGVVLLLSPQKSAERFRVLRVCQNGEVSLLDVGNDSVESVAAYKEHTAVLRAGSVYVYGRNFTLEKILTPTKLNIHSVMLIDGIRLLLRTDNELLAY